MTTDTTRTGLVRPSHKRTSVQLEKTHGPSSRSGSTGCASISEMRLFIAAFAKTQSRGAKHVVERAIPFARVAAVRSASHETRRSAFIRGAAQSASRDRGLCVRERSGPSRRAAVSKADYAWAARILGAGDAVTERTGAAVVGKSVNALREQAEREAHAGLGEERWALAYEAGRRASIDALLKDIDDLV